MTDIEVDQLLSTLNKIWQQKLKIEVNNVKAKYQNEIKDLRAKLNMRMPFDEFNMRKQNENLKKNLMSIRDTLRDNIVKILEKVENVMKMKTID